VDEPQAAQTRGAGAGAADVGQHELPGVAHDDVFHFSTAIEEDAELPSNVAGRFGEMARQLRGHQLARLHAASPGGEQPLALTRLQAGGVSEELFFHAVSSV
jgi:hypothetical protein